MMNILLVHENKNFIDSLKDALKVENFTVELANNFVEALEKYYYGCYEIIIIDNNVKNIEAKFFCEKVRNHNNKTGLICVSANNSIDLKIDLFKSGLDDFILDSVDCSELLYRIKALSRRIQYTDIIKEINLSFHNFKINMLDRTLFKDNFVIELTQKEFALIELLVRNKNLALNREHIRERIWGIDSKNNTNIVDVYINKIRSKIGDNQGKILQSVRGYGYILKE
ncbi:MAG: response regulator transcription factor [Fusobacterium gastrosuis]|uniref:response regulator transcription factor n=1 Tax=Fusobacterium gastrosuis TaxID=1755100 RepID=UPI002A8A53E8|nr:response regulator transcription factor [Fusobacterium gastrosuis]